MNNVQHKPTHTPGPWVITKRIDSEFPLAIDGTDGFQPCAVFGDGSNNKGTTQANASLIAAAPEMLHTLKEALREIDYLIEDGTLTPLAKSFPLYKHMEDVIAKAEGGGLKWNAQSVKA